jgi:TolA-binding protein
VAARHAGGNYRRGDRRHAWAVAAAVAMLASAGGAAAWVTLRRPPPLPPPPARSTTVSGGGAPAAQATSAAPASATAPDPIAASLAAAPAPPGAAHRPARAGLAPSAAAGSRKAGRLAPEPSAADLFAAANAARGVRDLRGAVTRYRLLQARYPGSTEAQVSYVSAGDLLAQLAAPAEALAQFDRYLATRPAGALAPEALFGRARSLQAQDRRADETEAWRDLLRRFPGSIYEVAARRRLDELAR